MKRNLLLCGILLTVAVATKSENEAPDSPKWPSYTENSHGFKLAPELEARIVKAPKPQRILTISDIQSLVAWDPTKPAKKQDGYTLLSISMELEGDFGFEGVWHGTLYFAKKASEPDWSNAVEFILPENTKFSDLRRLSPRDLETFLQQHKR